jgi:GNAT superfamily N-acetyltransferase
MTDTAPRSFIRRAQPAEWERYREIRLAALAEAPYAFGSTLDQERVLPRERWQWRLERGATYLAWDDERPVGTATGLPEDPDDEYHVHGGWQLVGMWVHPDSRGSGVAVGLVDAVAAHALRAGSATLVLWVTEVNDRARAFYQRLGFAYTGARQLVRDDEPDHFELQMRRDLAG